MKEGEGGVKLTPTLPQQKLPSKSPALLGLIAINFDNQPSKYPNWIPHFGTQCFQLTPNTGTSL